MASGAAAASDGRACVDGCRATPTRSAAYHFTYMIPQANEEVLQRYNEKGVPFKAILPIGEGIPGWVTCFS